MSTSLLAAARMPARIFRRFWRDWRGFLMVLRMAFWICTLSLLVKILPLPTTFRIITPRVKSRRPHDPEAVAAKLAALIDPLLALNVFVFTPTCWKRAAILHRYLTLSGVRNQIIFGVRNADEKPLEGHAWLQAGDQPILEKIAPQYKRIYAFPPA